MTGHGQMTRSRITQVCNSSKINTKSSPSPPLLLFFLLASMIRLPIIMRRNISLFLVLLWLRSVAFASSLAKISSGNGAVLPAARDYTAGYRSVAYFVNWVRSYPIYVANLSHIADRNLINRLFTAENLTPKTFQPSSSHMFCMHLLTCMPRQEKYTCQTPGLILKSTTLAILGMRTETTLMDV